MKKAAEEYEGALGKLKEELGKHVRPVPRMAPNEFQSRLRIALRHRREAHANRVKLPTSSTLVLIPLLPRCRTRGSALAGKSWRRLSGFSIPLLEARVEAVISFRRASCRKNAVATCRTPFQPAKSGAIPQLLERDIVK